MKEVMSNFIRFLLKKNGINCEPAQSILESCYIIIRYPITLRFCFEVFESVGYGEMSIKSLAYERKVIFVVKALFSMRVYQRCKFNKTGKKKKKKKVLRNK